MEIDGYEQIQSLDVAKPIWDNFFTVAPLVLIGTKDEGGEYNQAPKHMAAPMGWGNYFGFVCTEAHSTYQNIMREQVFTVTYPRPTQVILASLAATPRDDDNFKPALQSVPTFAAQKVDGQFVSAGYVFLECELERTVDELDRNTLIIGRIIAAHVHERALRLTDADEAALVASAPLLAYLQPGRFARIEHSHAFPFPTGFRL